MAGGRWPLKDSKVLVADDDSRNRTLLRTMLGERCHIVEAKNGREAVEIVEREPIDLVLLDLMMPEMSGYEACRRIKAQTERAGQYLPIIILTALGGQDDRNRGLAAGADDFLTKPVDRQELTLRVRTFLRLRRQERLSRLQIAELKEFDGLKDELVALLVHDLRNPLSGIVGALDVMSGALVDPSVQEDLQLAMEASTKLREILEDLLQVRFFDSRGVTLQRESIGADQVLDDAIGTVAGAARAREVHIERLVDAIDPYVDIDRRLVRRALENLLVNAVKYSPAGGEVQAAVHSVDGGIEIEVADRGVGVPDQFKRELFTKFGSVEAARGGVRRGWGLGLYLVDLVATAHGGRARVSDRDGGGTTFGLFLPKVAAPLIGQPVGSAPRIS